MVISSSEEPYPIQSHKSPTYSAFLLVLIDPSPSKNPAA
jgi:hypothetical protein